MDDFRIGPLEYGDLHSTQTQDESQKRSKHRHHVPEPEEDEVTLSSEEDAEEAPPDYAPHWPPDSK